MKNRFTEGGPLPLPPECKDTHGWLALLSGLVLAIAILSAVSSGAEEPDRVAQAGDPESPPAASDSAAEPDPDEPDPTEPDPTEPDSAEPDPVAQQGTSARRGIEEIVVLGAESEATKDFGAADSVTGFGAEDLAALGAQDIADLAGFTPNLEIVTAGATTPTFFIRGVGLNDFNSNSTGAVAIYRDDVPFNAPALQLSALYDVEAVNILRGPQGSGLARNASAGAIKIYSRKPTGEFGGYLRSELGNFDFRDFEGAVEAPIFEDVLAARLAFRLSMRDGTMKNRCGDAPAFEDRVEVPKPKDLTKLGLKDTYTGGSVYPPGFFFPDGTPIPPGTPVEPWSVCGEPVERRGRRPWVSDIPTGLESRVNNLDNWGARGTLLFQPTLDMTWLLNAHGSRRDELSRLGQSHGTSGSFCKDGDVENCAIPGTSKQCVAPAANEGNVCDVDSDCDSPGGVSDGVCTSEVRGVLGGPQGVGGAGYQPQEVIQRLERLAPCFEGDFGEPAGDCLQTPEGREESNKAKITVAQELAEGLDSQPWAGDFNRTGPTTNDVWGGYLKGDIVLPLEMQLITVSSFDTYDRLIDIDLDFSPETLFQIVTDDDGWQATQNLQLQGQIGDESPLRWDVGSWFLRERLDVVVTNNFGSGTNLAVGQRSYTQDLWSAAGYANLSFDFWDDFTLDGGFRYNWEQKKLDYQLVTGVFSRPVVENLNETWDAPTGTVRLTYKFREDTHVFWKYTRGFKPGTYNATSSLGEGVSVADQEEIDAFEVGVRGSWFDGRVGLDFSLFYYSYTDYQIFTAQQFAGGQPEFVILNADEAEVYGAEVDAVGRPWSGAFVNVRFGWLESQFLDFVQIQQEIVQIRGVQTTVNRELQNTGNSLLNSPEFKVSITAEQVVPLGRWGSVTARYDGVWTDTSYYDATEGRGIPNVANVSFLPKDTIAQSAFWVHNLRFAYRPPGAGFEVAGWVRNLTDEAFKTFAFDASTFNDTTIYFVGDPRTYGITVNVNF